MAEKTIESLNQQIAKVEAQREQLFERKKPIDAGLTRTYNKIEKLTKERDELLIASGKVDWSTLLAETGMTGMTMYKECEKRLAEYGLAHSGYVPKTQQRCIQISVADDASDEDIAKKAEGIQMLLTFLKPLDDTDFGLKRVIPFDVMEYTLSKHGSYAARYEIDTGRWHLVKMAYYRASTISTHDSLEEFLQMLKEKHPYPKERDYD